MNDTINYEKMANKEFIDNLRNIAFQNAKISIENYRRRVNNMFFEEELDKVRNIEFISTSMMLEGANVKAKEVEGILKRFLDKFDVLIVYSKTINDRNCRNRNYKMIHESEEMNLENAKLEEERKIKYHMKKWSDFTKENISKEKDNSGVYELVDSNGDVIYIGQSKNVRNRLMSYFQNGMAVISKYKIEYVPRREIISKKDIQQKLPTKEIPILPDNYISRVMKYIPSEVIALYLMLDAIIRSSETNLQLYWTIFIFCIIATPLYLWRVQKVNKKKQLLISTTAFIVWIFAIGGPFVYVSWYKPLFGGLLLSIYTFMISLIEV